MEFRSYNAELALANMMFKNIFSNIIINKTDAKGNVMPIAVNCQLAQRSRIFKSWQNAERRAKMKLPMIAISRTGYSRNPQRLNNLHNEVKYELSSKNRIYEPIVHGQMTGDFISLFFLHAVISNSLLL